MEIKEEKKEEWEIYMKTDSEIRDIIERQKRSLLLLGHTLPDKGQKLEANLNRYVDELKRRFKQSSEPQFGVATNSAVGITEHDSLTDGKMQKIVNELLNIGISQIDVVGKAAEICYKDPVKLKLLFALPSHMRKSYVLDISLYWAQDKKEVGL